MQAELEELALTLQVEAGAYERLQLHRVTDATPVEVARRALAPAPQRGGLWARKSFRCSHRLTSPACCKTTKRAMSVPSSPAHGPRWSQLRVAVAALNAEARAKAVERAEKASALHETLHSWVQAALALERASGIAERSARQRYETTSRTLQAAGETFFDIKRTFK